MELEAEIARLRALLAHCTCGNAKLTVKESWYKKWLQKWFCSSQRGAITPIDRSLSIETLTKSSDSSPIQPKRKRKSKP
jgi:hypothetical protein